MNIRYRARALADLEDIFQYLDERSPAGAQNVLRALHNAVADIADHPLASPRTSDPEIRVRILGGIATRFSMRSPQMTLSRSYTFGTRRAGRGTRSL
jgi:plasmid stabilization system protein ParE